MPRGLGGLSEKSRVVNAIRGISKKSDNRSGWGRGLMKEYPQYGQQIKKGGKLYI